MMRDGAPFVVNGEPVLRAEIVDFWGLVFNPSTIHRLVHVWIGALIMGSAFILSISAWYLLTRRHEAFARRSIQGALLVTAIASLAALVSGDLQAKNVYREQPAKLAAFEGHYVTGPAGLALFGFPDDAAGRLRVPLQVPGLLSWLLEGDSAAPVLGLDAFRPEHRPPVAVPFFSYRLMVGIGVFFVALSVVGVWRLWRGTLFGSRWLLWVCVAAVVPAVLANQAGWFAAEVGRQPWVVHPPLARDASGAPLRDADGFVRYASVTVDLPDGTSRASIAGLTTRAGVSEAVGAGEVAGSIVMFGLLYLLLGALWIYVLDRKIRKGPEPGPAARDRQAADVMGAASALASRADGMTGPKEA
jgi:cytochrome d ubiquinol oxidase subunit I